MKRHEVRAARRRSKAARFSPVPVQIVILESRQLLSATAASAVSRVLAQPTVVVGNLGANGGGNSPVINSAVAGISPSQMQTAYGVNLISFGSVAGTGAGQTIAIIDAFNDPNIISDANSFSTTFGLPQFNGSGGPTLRVLNENGGTALPANDGADSWASRSPSTSSGRTPSRPRPTSSCMKAAPPEVSTYTLRRRRPQRRQEYRLFR
jgi:hypothetical protein